MSTPTAFTSLTAAELEAIAELPLDPATAIQHEIFRREWFRRYRGTPDYLYVDWDIRISWAEDAHLYFRARRNFTIPPALTDAQIRIIIPQSVVVTGDPGKVSLYYMDGFRIAGRRVAYRYAEVLALGGPYPQKIVLPHGSTYYAWSPEDFALARLEQPL